MLPRRVPGYRPELLDQLCATGEVVWVGAGLDRVALFFREDASVLGRPPAAPPPGGRGARPHPRGAGAERRCSGSTCSPRPGWSAERGAAGALGPRLGRRGDERRLAAAPRRAPLRRAEARAAAAPLLAPPRDRPHRDPGPLVARRPAVHRRRPTAAPSPSSCSSGRGSSPATASAARESPAATAPSTAS